MLVSVVLTVLVAGCATTQSSESAEPATVTVAALAEPAPAEPVAEPAPAEEPVVEPADQARPPARSRRASAPSRTWRRCLLAQGAYRAAQARGLLEEGRRLRRRCRQPRLERAGGPERPSTSIGGGFSRKGLIGQLVYEGYTREQAASGVDAVSPDWNEQAARSAQSASRHVGILPRRTDRPARLRRLHEGAGNPRRRRGRPLAMIEWPAAGSRL